MLITFSTGETHHLELFVTSLDENYSLILGYDWLARHNLSIDWMETKIMFNAHPQNFTSESAKVFFAISYLKKSALEWFKQGILEDDLTQAPEWRSSWTEFVKELWTHFRPTNPIGTAEAEL